MTSDLNALVRLKKSDIKPAIEMFSRTFLNDPLAAYIFPNEEKRCEDLQHYFRFRISYGILYGEVYAISPDIEGLAIWVHINNITMTYWQMFRAGGMRHFRMLGKEKIGKMFAIEKYTSAMHHRNADFPHWHLTPIGVDPKHQGKGYASKLMRPMFKRFDEENIACFLETQSQRNVEIYKRYDFKICEKGVIPEANLEHWAMVRLPKK